MRSLALLAAALALLLSGCPETAKEKLGDLEAARKETVNEYGGAPKRVLADTAARVSGSVQRGADRVDDVAME
jgi:hypothetical protein